LLRWVDWSVTVKTFLSRKYIRSISWRLNGRARASEYGQLIPAFVHRAVPVDTLRYRQSRTVRDKSQSVWASGGQSRQMPDCQGRESCATRKPFFPSAMYANRLELTMASFTSLASLIRLRR
jgi:hypothetical protein